MNRRPIYVAVVYFLAFFVLVNPAHAQSKRIDNPSPLTSDEISGVIDKNTKGNTYYYSFWANLGEVKITATVERDLNIDSISLMSVDFILYDSNSEVIAKKQAGIAYGGLNRNAVTKAQIQITKRQTLVLGINILGGMLADGVGKYKVRIDGADIESKTNSADSCGIEASLSGKIKNYNFPEKPRRLQILFVNGAIIIEPSSVESISICDPTNQLKTRQLNYGKINLPKEGEFYIYMKDGGSMRFDLSQISSVDIFQ